MSTKLIRDIAKLIHLAANVIETSADIYADSKAIESKGEESSDGKDE